MSRSLPKPDSAFAMQQKLQSPIRIFQIAQIFAMILKNAKQICSAFSIVNPYANTIANGPVGYVSAIAAPISLTLSMIIKRIAQIQTNIVMSEIGILAAMIIAKPNQAKIMAGAQNCVSNLERTPAEKPTVGVRV